MAIEVGNIVDGTVTGITKFGAFVDIGNQQTGLVHISEVTHGYVENISDVLKVQEAVKVKVLSIDGSKIGLSIKQTVEKARTDRNDRGERKQIDNPKYSDRNSDRPRRASSKQSFASFEDKMKMFLKDSDERLHDLKRNTESKRGGRGGRRE